MMTENTLLQVYSVIIFICDAVSEVAFGIATALHLFNF